MNLPQKSVETPKSPERRQIIKTVTESKKSHFLCKDFPDFTRQMFKRKFGKEWQMDISEENKLTFKYFPKPYLIPKFQIIIDESLEFTLATCGWFLPDDHEFYELFKRTVRNSEMHRIFSEIQSYQLCDGVKDTVGNTSVNVHSIPCEINLEDAIQSSNQVKTVNQSSDCRMLLNACSK